MDDRELPRKSDTSLKMAKLLNMEISGVRLFSPIAGKQSIDFNDQVILITGRNGSGKSTIIESIKYALTGSCTTEKINSSFFYDLNMLNAKEITPEVSLTFLGNDGHTYTVKRVAQVKGAKCQTKITTLYQDNTQIDTISDNINRKIPVLLGIPKPILEYVIFCRQADQTWPIEFKSADLKKRFDEIFGSDQYNKAVVAINDRVKAIKKKLGETTVAQTILSKDYETSNEHRKRANKLTKEVNELQDQITELDEEKKILESKIKEIEEKKTYIDELQKKIDKIDNEIQFQKKVKDEQAQKIQGTIIPLDDCESKKQTLKEEIQSSEENINLYKQLLDKNSQERKDLDENLSDKNDMLSKSEDSIKDLQYHITNYQKLITEFENNYNTNDYDGAYKEIVNKFDEVSKEKDDLEQSLKNEEEKQKRKIDALQRKKEEQKSKIDAKKRELDSIESQIKNLESYNEKECQHKLDEFKAAENELAKEKQSESSVESIKQKIEKNAEDTKNIDDDLNKIRDILKKYEEQDETERAISEHENILAKAQLTLDSKLKELRKIMKNDTIDYKNALNIVSNEYQKCNEAYQTADVEMRKKDKDVDIISNDLKSKEKDLTNIINERTKKLTKIQILCDENYDDVVNKLKDELQRCTNDLSKTEKSESIFRGFLDEAKEEKCQCPLCKRKFESITERDEFITEQIESVLEGIPDKIKALKEKEIEVKQKLESVESVHSDWIELQKINNIIPTREKEIQNLNSEIEIRKNELIRLKSNLNECLVNKDIMNEANLLAIKIQELNVDIAAELDEINNLKAKLNPSLRDKNEVINEKSEKEDRKANLQSERSKLMDEQSQAMTRENELQMKYSNTEKAYKDYSENLSKLKQLCGSKLEHIESKNKLDNDFKDIDKKFNDCEDNYNLKVKELNSKLVKVQNEYQQLKDKKLIMGKRVDDLKKSSEVIKSSSQEKTIEQVKQLKEDIKEIESKLEMNKQQKEKHEETLKRFKNDQDKSKTELNSIEEMIKYHQYNKSYQEKLHEKEDLESQKDKYASDEDIQNFTTDKEKLNKISHSLTQKSTEKKEREIRLRDENEQSKDYANTLTKFNQKTVEIAALEMAISDLDRYKKTLDENIIKYHARKIEEINQYIQVLWQETGSQMDIDNIYIQAEAETHKDDSKKARVSFKYSVKMVRLNNVVDMQLRCSEGQKVLVSLIIRIALAQAFSPSCCMVAFDEPTANLDFHKIYAFSSLVAKLFKERTKTGNTNVQLFLITHSGDFASRINLALGLRYYYDLTIKNDDGHQYSVIKKEDANRLNINDNE